MAFLPIRPVVVIAALVLAAGACGDDDEPNAEPVETTPSSTVPDDATDDDVSDETTAPPSASGGGTCSVDVSGDTQASWTGGGSPSDLIVSAWFDDAERELLGDDFTLIVNCTGPGNDYLGLLAGSDADETSVPMAPGSYPLMRNTGTQRSLFSPLLTLTDSDTNWGLSDDGGVLEITAFDDTTIAGTFELSMVDTLGGFDADGGEGEIVVTGSFEFPRR